MAYKALYRTYRPQLFREVIGQEVIVRTLKNAIANHKISHAYLFSGPRGTGKTTIARIFAKALNCEELTMLEPCDKCHSCHEISDSNSPDVIEIDAASNNGIDEIRDIRDKVKFLPSGSKYKIYIIDEVHMLSVGAFNALLKTLEEPPKYVIFILATTEPQKLPPTIISRCQRFDFKSLTVSEISKRLRLVCGKENVEISEEAVNAISESAEGALRDALSTLDQAISYSDEVVTIEDVNLVTGNLSYDMLIDLATYFSSGNVTESLEILNNLIDVGKEVNKIVSGLLQFYRDMLLYQNVDEDSVMYYKYIFGKERFKELANSTAPEKIFYYLDVLSELQLQIKYSTTPRIYLEIAIVKLINNTNKELDLKKRIDELEKQVSKTSNENNLTSSTSSNEKVEILEIKLNQVITELHKLDLHKISENVENFKGPNDYDNEQLKDIENRLKALENQNDSSVYSNMVSYLQEDINNLKLLITEIENKQFDKQTEDNEVIELKNKIIAIERSIFEILSGKLEEKEAGSKRKVNHPNQIVLFTDDLTPIENFEVDHMEVDFDDLAKVEDDGNSQEVEKDDDIVSETNDKDQDEELEKQKEIDELEVVEIKEPEELEADSEKSKVIEKKYDEELVKESKDPGIIRNKISQHSQVVVTDSSNVDIFKREKELMEKELSRVKPSHLDKKESDHIEETSKSNLYNSSENESHEKEEFDRFSSYDIRIVESILHQSFTEEARNDMKRINEIWPNLDKEASSKDMGIVEILKEGKIVAVGNKEFIITYKSATLCNQVMRFAFKKRSVHIFEQALGDKYNYMALPEKVWLEKRQEYINQYTIGTKYPKLSQINDPELVITKNEYKDPKEKIINKIISTFGDDIVNVE